MGIIRFSDEEVFGVDSTDYDILHRGVLAARGVEGAIVEIGTRRGGSAKLIIDTLVQNNDARRSMFCIDPYGNIEYSYTNKAASVHYPGKQLEGDPQSTEVTQPMRLDYTNDMRNRIIPSLYYYAYNAGLNFTFFCLEDTEFFNRYGDGVPVYDQYKKMENAYALVFFDGPHDNSGVNREVDFFIPRTPIGGVYVFDDIWMYDHESVEQKIFAQGFELIEKKEIKASYVRKSNGQ